MGLEMTEKTVSAEAIEPTGAKATCFSDILKFLKSSEGDLAAVFYTDGGFKAEGPGYMGYGSHGYIYDPKAPAPDAKKIYSIEGFTTTTASYFPRNTIAKMPKTSALVTPLAFMNYIGSAGYPGSNNQAEIKAFYETLQIAQALNIKQVLFLLDSEYTLNAITKWCQSWVRNGWKKADGGPVSNAELLGPAYRLYTDLIAQGFTLNLRHVKAHAGEFGNEQADQLATLGINYSKSVGEHYFLDINTPKHFVESEIERNPLLSLDRIYFNTDPKYHIPGQYMSAGNDGEDYLIGKRTPETVFSFFIAQTAIPEIEAVFKAQFAAAEGNNAIVMLRMDRLYNKLVSKQVSQHQALAFNKDARSININAPDRAPVTVEVNPTGLSMRAIDALNFLEQALQSFICMSAGIPFINPVRVLRHDITSVFFDKVEVVKKSETVTKCSLKSEIGTALKMLPVKISLSHNDQIVEKEVPLIFGLDLPPRNNIKRIEDYDPEVYVVTWQESDNSFRYATVVNSTLGIGIWSNFFSDRIFF